MDGSDYTFSVTGSEANTSVKVYIDSKEYYTCTVDFSVSNPTVSNANYANSSSSGVAKVLPDVTGKNMEDAKATLISAGFNNIKINYVSDGISSSDNGKVISQSPSSTLLPTVSTSTQIVLTVGQKTGI